MNAISRRSIVWALTTILLLASPAFALGPSKKTPRNDVLEETKNLRTASTTTTTKLDDIAGKVTSGRRSAQQRRRAQTIVSYDHPLERSRHMQQVVESEAKKTKSIPTKETNGISSLGTRTTNHSPLVDHPLQEEGGQSNPQSSETTGTSTIDTPWNSPFQQNQLSTKQVKSHGDQKISVPEIESVNSDGTIVDDYQPASENTVRLVVSCDDYETFDACERAIAFALNGSNKFEVRYRLELSQDISITTDESNLDRLSDFDYNRAVKRFPLHIPESLNIMDGRRLQSEQFVPYGIDMVQARDFWEEYQVRGGGVKVCVLDTGIDEGHEDLGNVMGIDVTPGDNVEDWRFDIDGHGTHVSGSIAALDNGLGVVGVAPDAEIISIKVFDDDSGDFYDDDINAAVQACKEAGARVISMSLGGPGTVPGEQRVMNQLFNSDIVLVAAAGNTGTGIKIYPAAYNSVISVAAVDSDGSRSGFSTYNDRVDIAAPGGDVISTYPGSRYASLSGTSMACPHVSAVAALLISKAGNVKAEDIVNAIELTAVDKGSAGRDDFYGYGIVQAVEAMKFLDGDQDAGTPNNPGSPPDNGSDPGNPPDSGNPGNSNCQDQTFSFEMNLLTDSWPEETSWAIVDHDTESVIKFGNGYSANTMNNEEFCLDRNHCYTWIIHDELLDGICCVGEGNDGYYEIFIDGELVQKGDDFGQHEFYSFGSCDDCLEFIVELETDFWAAEIRQSLVIEGVEEEMWSRFDLNNNWSYTTVFQCLDPTVCYRYYIEDSAGDGIKPGGNLKLQKNGEEIYNGGSFGEGGFIEVGNC